MGKFLSWIPLWHIARFAALLLLAVILLKPITELLAIKSMVVFYCGDQATLEWDPPSLGIADHYIVEATTVKPLDGSNNSISWVNYYDSNTTSLKIALQDGYNYSFRVKAVGPTGQESPYSEEQLTVICDCSAPSLKVEPFGTGSSIIRQEVLHLTGLGGDFELRRQEALSLIEKGNMVHSVQDCLHKHFNPCIFKPAILIHFHAAGNTFL